MATKKILIQIQVGAKDANIAVANVTKAMEGLSSAQIKVNKNTKNNTASAGLHNAILMESGRLASDLNYGFTAIANNLGQLFSLFQASADSAEGLGAAFKKLISLQALFLIGGQILIQNLDKVVKFVKQTFFAMQDLDKVFDNAASTVKDVNAKFELYISTLEDSTKSEEEKKIAIEKLNKEYPDYIKNLNNSKVSIEDVKNKTKEATRQNDLYRESILKLALSEAAKEEIAKIDSQILQETINLRKIQIEEGYKSQEEVNLAIKTKETEIETEKRRYRQLEQSLEGFDAVSKSQILQNSQALARINFLNDEIDLLKGENRQYLGLTDSIQGKIDKLNEEKKLYEEFIDLRKNKSKSDTEDDDAENKRLAAKVQYAKDHIKFLQEAEKATAITDEEKRELELAQIGDYYDNLIDQAKIFGEDTLLLEEYKLKAIADKRKEYSDEDLKNAEEARQAKAKIDKLETESKLEALDNIGKGLVSASKIAGESTGVGKALAVAGTLVSTYSAGQKAYESQMTLTPDAPIRAQIARAAAILQGLANVKAIMSVKSPAMKETSAVTGGQAALTTSSPDFNVVGQGGVNQLGQVIGSQFAGPLRAYVVSGDISTAQELDRNITDTATVG